MKKRMFNDKYGLTEAVLSGRKTMFREIFKKETVGELTIECNPVRLDEHLYGVNIHVTRNHLPKYKVGEVVAVAQSYKIIDKSFAAANCINCPILEDNISDYGCENNAGWGNKMFVKADLMPHQIKITNIRAERLQDISDEDCLCEGVRVLPDNARTRAFGFSGKFELDNDFMVYDQPKEAFSNLIDRISGKGTWGHNPYVFVYEFELLK